MIFSVVGCSFIYLCWTSTAFFSLLTLTRGLLESETELRELSAKFVFAVPDSSTLGFLLLGLHWVSIAFSFHSTKFGWVVLLLCLASASQGLSQGCFSQLTLESQHQICQESVQFPRFCLTRAKISNTRPVLQLGYSSEFYSTSKGKYTLESWRWPSPKGEASLSLGFLHLYFVYSPLSLPYVNWASLEGGLLYLRFSLWFSDFLLFHFYGFFFSFLCILPTAILDSVFLFWLPNIWILNLFFSDESGWMLINLLFF